MSIKTQIKHIIRCSLEQLGIEKEIIIDIPKDKKNGDYSTNIALTLSKQLKKDPLEIANMIVHNINDSLIEKIEVVKPGFINIFVSKKYLLDVIQKILTEGKKFGSNNIGNNKKINVEYVSANPTGILHIGHGRGATYGDNLSRILKFNGYDITREYYINDAGNQMNNLGISIKERYKQLCGLDYDIPEDGYHGKEIITIAQKILDEYGNKKVDSEIEFFKQEGLNILLDKIKKDLDTYRVNFDIFTSEKSLYDKGEVEEVLNKLKLSNKCYIDEGALWLKTSDYGDEKDRVLIKNDGNYTYLLPDIAYHINKFNRGYQNLIDVLGSDHHGYINRLKASLEILGKDKDMLDIKILQMVRLIQDGKELKLSKRTGKTITLIDLINEVGINATRYFFASKSIDTQMDFDLDLAKKETNENPVYYIEYANARISSILRNYQFKNKEITNYVTLNNEITYNILNKLYEFEDIVISAGEKKLPHLVANYVYELATLFHSYYANEKIITDDIKSTEEKIMFIEAIKIVINNALNLIGIIPREEM